MHANSSADSCWCICLDLLKITKSLEVLFDIQQGCVIHFTQLQIIVYHLQYCWLFLAKQGRVGLQWVLRRMQENKINFKNSIQIQSCMHLLHYMCNYWIRESWSSPPVEDKKPSAWGVWPRISSHFSREGGLPSFSPPRNWSSLKEKAWHLRVPKEHKLHWNPSDGM